MWSSHDRGARYVLPWSGGSNRQAERAVPAAGVAELRRMTSVALIGTAEQNVRTGERALLLDLRESPSPD
jgi:hypothetical protein